VYTKRERSRRRLNPVSGQLQPSAAQLLYQVCDSNIIKTAKRERSAHAWAPWTLDAAVHAVDHNYSTNSIGHVMTSSKRPTKKGCQMLEHLGHWTVYAVDFNYSTDSIKYICDMTSSKRATEKGWQSLDTPVTLFTLLLSIHYTFDHGLEVFA
jgi:hypothetical protein